MKILLVVIVLLVSVPLFMVAGALYRNDLPWSAPPGPLARLKTYIRTHVARTRDRHPCPELRSLHVRTDVTRLRGEMPGIIARLGWVLAPGREGDVIHAVATTPLLGYRDDVFITLRGLPDGGSIVDVESVSRVGHGDLGANTRHVLDLYAAIGASEAAGD